MVVYFAITLKTSYGTFKKVLFLGCVSLACLGTLYEIKNFQYLESLFFVSP
tara:strand:+ start:450 stop:602 length:153 start_codon:yes stop_codon:yes gene_type:complete